jgi:CheY-like chemotaxis protein
MPKFMWRCKLSAPKKNILIVEDDIQLRLLLSVILTQAGYKVRSAEDGFAALAEMRADVPDILLSDLFMSGMSGFELLSVVRRRFPSILVIAMSSAYAGSAVPTAIAADAFYEKATKVTALLQMVAATPQFDGLYSIYRPGSPAPVWIDVASGEAHIVMTCPECLRTFTHAEAKVGGLIHQAGCAHCHNLMQYAIVQPASPAPSLQLLREIKQESLTAA